MSRLLSERSTLVAPTPGADSRYLSASGYPLARTALRIQQGLPVKVVAIGDSIPEGTTTTSGGGVLGVDDFVSLVTTGIAARTTGGATQSNRAVSGRTAGTGWQLGDIPLALADAGDLYLIAYGHNDLRSDGVTPGTGYPKSAMARSIEKIIRRIRDEIPAADIVLVLENAYTSGSASNPLLVGQNALLRPLAAFYGCAVADTYTAFLNQGDWSGLLSDGAHPNKAGHALYAQTILGLIPTAGLSRTVAVPNADLNGAARVGKTWLEKTAVGSTAVLTDSVRYVLSGTWDTVTNAPHTSTAANSLVRVFTWGDEATLQLDCGAGQGTVTVTIDNRAAQTIDLSTYPAGQRFLPYIGLGSGAHYIEVKLVSGSMTFRGVGTPSRTGYSLDLTDTTKVARTGTWTQTTLATSSPSGYSLGTSTVGDMLQVTMFGTALYATTTHFSSNQQIEVQVDGGSWVSKEVSVSGMTGGSGGPAAMVTGLSLGRHVIGLRMAGVRVLTVYDITALDETMTGHKRDTDIAAAMRSALG